MALALIPEKVLIAMSSCTSIWLGPSIRHKVILYHENWKAKGLGKSCALRTSKFPTANADVLQRNQTRRMKFENKTYAFILNLKYKSWQNIYEEFFFNCLKCISSSAARSRLAAAAPVTH